jgi:Tfp pilus assembly protein FimT
MIELAIVLVVVAILAAIALPNISFARMRMDGAAGSVQNNVIAAQAQTVQHNYPFLLVFCIASAQYQMIGDTNSNGVFDAGETVTLRTLPEGMRFVIPPTTIDGATPNYVTGQGLTSIDGSNCGSSNPTLTFYPNGSTSGEAVIYLGSGNSARLEDFRALQVYASTSKVHMWRMMKDGTWKQASQ